MKDRNLNRGRIWSIDRKQIASQPDFAGTIDVEGEEFLISAWRRSEGTGSDTQRLSFSLRPKRRNVIGQPGDHIVDPATPRGYRRP